MRLKDKVILVTAYTRGIGLAIVKACAREGAIVYMAARNLEKAALVSKELNDQGLRAKIVYNDAYKKDTYISMIEETVKNEGKIDVIVNNFGTSNPKMDMDIKNTKYDEYINTIDANLDSVFISSQKAIEYMAKNGGGSIINISSIGSLIPDISQISYATSKSSANT